MSTVTGAGTIAPAAAPFCSSTALRDRLSARTRRHHARTDVSVVPHRRATSFVATPSAASSKRLGLNDLAVGNDDERAIPHQRSTLLVRHHQGLCDQDQRTVKLATKPLSATNHEVTVTMADRLSAPMIRSPSQCPGRARSAASGGRTPGWRCQ